MKSVIIPDVHERIAAVETILKSEHADEYIFLGDWFDRWPSQPGNREDTKLWLQEHGKDTDKIFLLGNHDMPYAFPGIPALMCSGYQWVDAPQVRDALLSAPVRLAYECQGYLLSHAGFNLQYLGDNEGLIKLSEFALQNARDKKMHQLFNAGSARGGYGIGGCTWLDWNEEFIDYPTRPQIVGHTTHKEPQRKGDSWCIDTKLNHYAVLKNGQLSIKELKTK